MRRVHVRPQQCLTCSCLAYHGWQVHLCRLLDEVTSAAVVVAGRWDVRGLLLALLAPERGALCTHALPWLSLLQG